MDNGLEALISYWKGIFSSQNPTEELKQLPTYILDRFQTEFLPEPYYGYFHEDMSKDVLLLLLNPGHKDVGDNDAVLHWNQTVRERYTRPWGTKDYLIEEERLKERSPWRFQKLQQVKGIVGEVGFLHTMEFFPFHSKSDKLPFSFKKTWMNEFQCTNLAFEALKDIAIHHKVKHIFSTSSDWTRVLEARGVPLTHEVELKRHNGRSFSFNFKVFQFTEEALPMLMCNIRGNAKMNLPTNPFAVEIARIFIGLSDNAIPSENQEYEVTVRR